MDNEGKTISDQYNYKRNEIACKAITEKYGHHFGAGKEQVNRDRLKGSEKFSTGCGFLLSEYQKEAMEYPYTAPYFHPEVTLWAINKP